MLSKVSLWVISASVLCIYINFSPSFVRAHDENTITFENQSGQPALVKLIGPTSKSIRVPDKGSRTLHVTEGKYYILTRYGESQEHYSYAKGDPFEVTEAETHYSQITITLHKVRNGNYGMDPISGMEFEKEMRGAALYESGSANRLSPEPKPKTGMRAVQVPETKLPNIKVPEFEPPELPDFDPSMSAFPEPEMPDISPVLKTSKEEENNIDMTMTASSERTYLKKNESRMTDAGKLHIKAPAKLMDLWSAWNGKYVLFAHKTAGIDQFQDLNGKKLFIAIINIELENITADAKTFKESGGLANTKIYLQNNTELYDAQFLEDPNCIAFLIPEVAKHYGFFENKNLVELKFVSSMKRTK